MTLRCAACASPPTTTIIAFRTLFPCAMGPNGGGVQLMSSPSPTHGRAGKPGPACQAKERPLLHAHMTPALATLAGRTAAGIWPPAGAIMGPSGSLSPETGAIFLGACDGACSFTITREPRPSRPLGGRLASAPACAPQCRQRKRGCQPHCPWFGCWHADRASAWVFRRRSSAAATGVLAITLACSSAPPPLLLFLLLISPA